MADARPDAGPDARPGVGRVVVLLPVKPLRDAKTRLQGALGDEAREALVLAMLTDTLAAVRGAHDGPVLLVSNDAAYDAAGARFGAVRVPDAATGYNEAIASALDAPEARDAEAILVVPADVPCATGEDIRAALDALASAGLVVAAAFDGGTAVLGLRPPRAVPTQFGPDSAERHRRVALAAGLSVAVLDLPSLVRDIDTIEDLWLAAPALGAATRAFVEAHAALRPACD